FAEAFAFPLALSFALSLTLADTLALALSLSLSLALSLPLTLALTLPLALPFPLTFTLSHFARCAANGILQRIQLCVGFGLQPFEFFCRLFQSLTAGIGVSLVHRGGGIRHMLCQLLQFTSSDIGCILKAFRHFLEIGLRGFVQIFFNAANFLCRVFEIEHKQAVRDRFGQWRRRQCLCNSFESVCDLSRIEVAFGERLLQFGKALTQLLLRHATVLERFDNLRELLSEVILVQCLGFFQQLQRLVQLSLLRVIQGEWRSTF